MLTLCSVPHDRSLIPCGMKNTEGQPFHGKACILPVSDIATVSEYVLVLVQFTN